MTRLPPPTPVSRETHQLEASLGQVEAELGALGEALKQQDAVATESAASNLHRALTLAMDCFGRAARQGALPPDLRRRLALTGGQVAAQREAVARATSALDRAMDILLPDLSTTRQTPLYGAQGMALRTNGAGLAQA